MANRIEVIDSFLSNWKKDAYAWYKEARKTYEELNKIKDEKFPTQYYEYNGRTNSTSSYMQLNNYCIAKWGKGCFAIIKDIAKFDDSLLELLDKEVERKYKALIKAIEKKAGNIVDATMLCIGEDDCSLNGLVVGDKEKVSVNTIGAGGYNIQIFHYRTIVKIIK